MNQVGKNVVQRLNILGSANQKRCSDLYSGHSTGGLLTRTWKANVTVQVSEHCDSHAGASVTEIRKHFAFPAVFDHN